GLIRASVAGPSSRKHLTGSVRNRREKQLMKDYEDGLVGARRLMVCDLNALASQLRQGEKDVLHQLIGQLREWCDRAESRIFGTFPEVIDAVPVQPTAPNT